MKALIVEDSLMIREGIIEMLNPVQNLFIYQAENGQKALTVFENECPEIVILDLGLPYLSGIEVLRQIKNKKPEVKIIVLTNHSDKYFNDICLKYGADYFFDKSDHLDKFIDTVKTLSKQPQK